MAGTQNLRYATEYQIDAIKLLTSMTNGTIDLIPQLVELNLFDKL